MLDGDTGNVKGNDNTVATRDDHGVHYTINNYGNDGSKPAGKSDTLSGSGKDAGASKGEIHMLQKIEPTSGLHTHINTHWCWRTITLK